jgi:ATP-binding cassette subfamily C protein CydC
MTRARDPLWRAVGMLRVRPGRAAIAVLTGAAGMGSAVALAAVSAWLIARASQMPPVMTLTIAVVAVRTFGISRGVLRYLERLASHDIALRGMATLRADLYRRLAAQETGTLLSLRRGDLLARVGADVDSVGDVVVRGLMPIGVAALVSAGSVLAVGAFLPVAGVGLALSLVLAGVVAPWLAVRAARTAEARSARARARLGSATLSMLEGAAELRVSGRFDGRLAELRDAERELARATDAAARPAAVAAALGPLAVGLAVLASLRWGIPATAAGSLDPVELAVVVLTPLAAFEAVALLPGAGVALLRSRQAARRVIELLAPGTAGGPGPIEPADGNQGVHRTTPGPLAPAEPASLVATGLTCGWPGRPILTSIDLELTPGRRVAVVGPSGVGKTTLLLTLAGLLPPLAGDVLVDGVPVHTLPRSEAARRVTMTAEDAHVFDTNVLENLRVGRGDVTGAEAADALAAVGLGDWLAGLPDGLDTLLGFDAARVSGGERRRLLLARALLGPAPLLLLDEPTEHVDTGAADLLTGLLDGRLTRGRGVVVVTHRPDLEAAQEVIWLDRTGSVRARGPHRTLLDGPHGPEYRSAWEGSNPGDR